MKINVQYTITESKETDLDIPEGARITTMKIGDKDIFAESNDELLKLLIQTLDASGFDKIEIKGKDVPLANLILLGTRAIPLLLNKFGPLIGLLAKTIL